MNSKSITPVSTTHREDYCPPAFWIDSVDLTFDLDAAKTRVLNKMRVRRNPAVAAQALRLDGDGLTLARVLVNGQGTSFKIDGSALVLENLPEGEQPFALANAHAAPQPAQDLPDLADILHAVEAVSLFGTGRLHQAVAPLPGSQGHGIDSSQARDFADRVNPFIRCEGRRV